MAASHVFNPFIPQLTTGAAPPPPKAYTSAVQAGDLLWCYAWVNSATATISSVIDNLNNTAWTQAFGPVRGDSNNANATLYGFYLPNSAAGTPTVTVSTSANTQGGFVLGAVRGLAGGGTIDAPATVSGKIVGPPVGYQLTSAALAQSGEAGVAFIIASAGPTTPLWTAAGNVDSVNFERGQLTVTANALAQTVGTVGSSSGTATLGGMFFKDLAVAALSGNVTLDDSAPGGGMSSVASSLSGNVTLDDSAPAGTLGAAPGRIRLLGVNDEWRNKAGTLLASKACTVDVHSTAGTHLARISTTTGSDGLIPEISHGSISQSTLYRLDVLFGTGEYGVVYRTSEAT